MTRQNSLVLPQETNPSHGWGAVLQFRRFGALCNGSTSAFGADYLGSNPGAPAWTSRLHAGLFSPWWVSHALPGLQAHPY